MTASGPPRVSIGLPVYNGERYLRSALDSLLEQSFTDLELIISDNASTDATPEICQEYARRDQRITVLRNGSNQGMVHNFRKVFEESRGEYFMWASDHDLWHPKWLETHVQVLQECPDVVLAYPLVVAIDSQGEELVKDPRRFDTSGMGTGERVRAACTRMKGAGNMVYGLFRAEALARTSVYPSFITPDRLLLLELSMHGAFRQVPRYLWFRRYLDGGPNLEGIRDDYLEIVRRQRERLFQEGRTPWHSRVPTLGVAMGLLLHQRLRPPWAGLSKTALASYMAYLYLRRRRRQLMLELKTLLPWKFAA
jgi:glycosyltransferase involved in cell wall biosynthesis